MMWLRAIVGISVALTLASPTMLWGQSRNPPLRRGAPGAPRGPLTDVSIAVGSAQYSASVDARCRLDERATPSNTRAYFVAMYPWFGQRPAADQPQWRVTLEIRRGASPDAYDQFVFSFLDGTKAATIQRVAGSPKMGNGTVRVTRHGAGARFDIAGRAKEGDAVRATIDCPQFQRGEEGGG
ncbi:MAG: hypothetical protein LC753_06660 [Acidobacteria bacterium]|nr:hypothetical protein [Acidobacteriota bacterium]MCA1649969.1 hypothetical protein [Acidobacteriota bacterium]